MRLMIHKIVTKENEEVEPETWFAIIYGSIYEFLW